jgi:Xaa-Pro dipeptidase
MQRMIGPFDDRELRARRQTVAAELARAGLDGALVSDPANVRYLGGFALEQPWVSRTRPTFLVLDAAGSVTVVASTAVTLDDPPVDAIVRYAAIGELPTVVASALAAAGPAIGAELGGEHRIGAGLDEHRAIQAAHATRFGDAGPALWAARLVKSRAELDRLRAASAVGDRVYARLFGGEIQVGECEVDLGRRIRRMMLEEGADEPGWVMLTAGRGSYDRLLSTPRDRPIARDELIWLDLACRVDGYWSDHSRACVVGPVPDEAIACQELVVAATERGIGAVRPGGRLADVAAAAAIAGEAAPGRLGHGVGLGTTEPPDVTVTSSLVLEPGMVFTVEPIAIRDHGMYQAEAVVAVTTAGYEILTHAPTAITSVEARMSPS